MNKVEIKTILEEAGVTVNDDMIGNLYKHLEKTVPYSRFQSKIKELGDATSNYGELEAKYNKTIADMEITKTSATELESYKTKWEAHEAKELESFKGSYAKRMEVFNITDKDKRFETVSRLKDSFTFAEEGKQLSIDQMKSNIGQLDLLEKTGVLAVPTTDAPTTPAPSGNTTQAPSLSPSGNYFASATK